MQTSEIAREGKHLDILIETKTRPRCILCTGAENWLQHNYGHAILYADTIFIAGQKVQLFYENALCANKEHHNFGLEAAKIIE